MHNIMLYFPLFGQFMHDLDEYLSIVKDVLLDRLPLLVEVSRRTTG
jgi:hypothetical protein